MAVIKVAREMDYLPNSAAANLRKGRGNTIGVLIPNIQRQFFTSVINGIDEVASSKGFNVMIMQSRESFEREKMIVEGLLDGRIEGLIASLSLETTEYSHFKACIRWGLPTVFFDRVIEEMDSNQVILDDYGGAFKSVEHLVNSGCKLIAHFSGNVAINVYRDRRRGYINALKKHGLPVMEELIIEDTLTKETGYHAMKSLWKNSPKPDGLFSSGDYSALGAMIYLQERHVDIPGKIKISGFANELFDEFIQPPLTSVDQHGYDMGKIAAAMLFEEILSGRVEEREKRPTRKITVNPDLITRASTSLNI